MKPYYSDLFGEEVLLVSNHHGLAAMERSDPQRAVYTDAELILIRKYTNETKKLIHLSKKLFSGTLYEG